MHHQMKFLYMSHAGDPGSIPESERSAGEGIGYPLQYSWASFVAQLVKNPPAMQVDSIPGSGRSPGKGIGYPLQYSWASLVAQMVKNPPAMQETWVQSLGWEDSPGGGHGNPLQYSCLENPIEQRSLVGYSPWGHKELDMTEQLSAVQAWDV